MRALLLFIALLGPIEQMDGALQRAVQANRSPLWERPMRAATEVGRPPLVLGILLAVAVFGGPAGVATARETVLALVPANLVVEGLKEVVGRVRPDGDRQRKNSSFPSSHAANAAAIAAVLARRFRRLTLPLWLVAAFVAWSRVYLNRHFLSDVLAGIVIGLASAWLAARWARRWDVAHARDIRPPDHLSDIPT
jgi:undecaprenyl-diphosphatase